jgi:hypothetical protein
VRADAEGDDPLGVLDAFTVSFRVSKGGQGDGGFDRNLLLAAAANEDRFSSPLDSHGLAHSNLGLN